MLVVVGISYTFALRLIGTFWPDIFRNLLVARVSLVLSFLASLTLVLFFIYLREDYVREEQKRLKLASVLVIIGSTAMVLLHVKGLLILFRVYISFYLVGFHHVEAVVPWVCSILILYFFIVIFKETLQDERPKLKKAAMSAVMGSSVAALIRTFILLYHFCSRDVVWFADLPGRIGNVFVPISAVAFIAVLYFFSSFYKEQKCRHQ
ncbi:MAG: hypothetical protein KAX38_09900 [Candidatus Krumholzibacteria bacterium]|nr:hypothetical protein [Candidatus Krumholzibacteria bacterium]